MSIDNNQKIENQQNSGLRFSDIWHAFKTNILWEILIFIVIFALGFCASLTIKDTYVAKARVIVKASIEEVAMPENISLSQQLAPEVAKLVGDEDTNTYIEGIKGLDLSGCSMSASVDNENSMQIIISFSHAVKQKAEEGIKQYIKAFGEYLKDQSPFDGIANVEINTTVPSYDVMSPTLSVNSAKNKTILLSGVLALVGVVAYLVIVMLVGDKVSSVSRLESLTGKKNLTEAGKVRSSGVNITQDGVAIANVNLDNLSDKLIVKQDIKDNKVIQVQSTLTGEGKTTIIFNLAKALGNNQRKVLILDCDFKNPTMHKYFNLAKERGLTDYVENTAMFNEIVKNTHFAGVDLITCGAEVSSATAMITSQAFTNLISEAKQRYDFILIDCVPVSVASNYLSISQIADSTLLVVEKDRVKSKELVVAINELNACGANVIGTVFNK